MYYLCTLNIRDMEVIAWLEKRIEMTVKERQEAVVLDKKISKGAKLTAYKEMLNYMKTHPLPANI